MTPDMASEGLVEFCDGQSESRSPDGADDAPSTALCLSNPKTHLIGNTVATVKSEPVDTSVEVIPLEETYFDAVSELEIMEDDLVLSYSTIRCPCCSEEFVERFLIDEHLDKIHRAKITTEAIEVPKMIPSINV